MPADDIDELGKLFLGRDDNCTSLCIRANYAGQVRGHDFPLSIRHAGVIPNCTYENIGQFRTAQGFESGGAPRLQEQSGYRFMHIHCGVTRLKLGLPLTGR